MAPDHRFSARFQKVHPVTALDRRIERPRPAGAPGATSLRSSLFPGPVSFRQYVRSSRLLTLALLTATVAVLAHVPSALAQWQGGGAPPALLEAVDETHEAPALDVRTLVGDSLFGHSGALRARFVSPAAHAELPVMGDLIGDSAYTRAGVYAVHEPDGSAGFHFITMRPFTDKVGGRIGSYRIGSWSAERRAARSAGYGLPTGFIEVTAENRDTYVSRHFRLRDFLTKDQHDVWPKYLVLSEALLDKLELLITELEAEGFGKYRMTVMSGFRTPQYNAQGVGAGGRASESRHQFGDAADVYLRGERDWMPDLTGDGRIDTRDALRMARAAERVEAKYPDLVGGIGVYPATSAHGPFVHVDVRGTAARWGQW